MTWVIAHRGASRDWPENTLAAFDAALAPDCDGIELDVQLSRDEIPVVYHDRTLWRAGGGRRRVHRMDAAEVQRLDSGVHPELSHAMRRIPLLEEVLERYAGRTRLLVEIKTREGRDALERHRELAWRCAGLVRQAAGENWLLSFDERVLEAAAEVAPELPRVLDVRVNPGTRRRISGFVDLLDAVAVNIRTLTPGFARWLREIDRPLMTFTCNNAPRVRRSLEAGALAVMSDRPAWLARWLREHGAPS